MWTTKIEDKEFTLFFDIDQLQDAQISRLSDSGKITWLHERANMLLIRPVTLAFTADQNLSAIPILKKLEEWLKVEYGRVAPASAIGKAIACALKRWDKLLTYTTDGKLEIDNNLVENSIRPVSLGRKNYLFAGSHDAARRSAVFYSRFGSCKINNINPYEWLSDVLERIDDHSINRLEELLPNLWKPKQRC